MVWRRLQASSIGIFKLELLTVLLSYADLLQEAKLCAVQLGAHGPDFTRCVEEKAPEPNWGLDRRTYEEILRNVS